MTTATRVLVGQGALLTFTAYEDGTEEDLGTITIGIVDANGAEVVASGTAVVDNSDGTYEYTLAKQTSVKLLIATWSVSGGADFTTYIEVVGSELFNETQLRAFDNDAIPSTITDADIAATHDRVADYLENATGRSWIRRYNRAKLCGNGGRSVYLSDGVSVTSAGYPLNRPGSGQDIIRVISADDGTAKTVGDIQVGTLSGELALTDGTWTKATTGDPFNVVVEYEYGNPYPDGAVDRVAMLIAQQWITSSRIPSSAASFTDPLGSYTFDESRLPFEAYKWIQSHRTPVFFG